MANTLCRRRIALLVALLLLLSYRPCQAALIPPGKHAGVVIFDRWDGCELFHSSFLLYVSQAERAALRAQAGKWVQINATDIYQPENPGDALIRKFTLVAPPAPLPGGYDWQSPQGLAISADFAFKDHQPPAVTIKVANTTDKPMTLDLDQLAPTLLAKKPADHPQEFNPFDPSDGPSTAVISHNPLDMDFPPRHGGHGDWQFTITSPTPPKKSKLTIAPHHAFQAMLAFTLPAGEYDFLAGYGTPCIVSNQLWFDVNLLGNAVRKFQPASPATQPSDAAR